MNNTHVAVPEGIGITSPCMEDKKKFMRAKDLEKYFGVLKDSEIVDEIREKILQIRDIKD